MLIDIDLESARGLVRIWRLVWSPATEFQILNKHPMPFWGYLEGGGRLGCGSKAGDPG